MALLHTIILLESSKTTRCKPLLRGLLITCFSVLAWSYDIKNVLGKNSQYTLSFQYKAMTPNAGGQQAYSLRLSEDDNYEWSIFSNQFLQTGAYPLTGLVYDWRFSICPRHCFVRSFVQIGGGVSSAGPMVEILWNITPLWLMRIDFVTHFYFAQLKPIFWNYPLWLGVSVPL